MQNKSDQDAGANSPLTKSTTTSTTTTTTLSPATLDPERVTQRMSSAMTIRATLSLLQDLDQQHTEIHQPSISPPSGVTVQAAHDDKEVHEEDAPGMTSSPFLEKTSVKERKDVGVKGRVKEVKGEPPPKDERRR